MKKIIITDFFTTISKNHFFKSISFLTYKLPYIRKWKYTFKLEKKLLDYLNLYDSKIVSFYNARTALYHALILLGVKKNDEIILNWYNCISVVNSIIQAECKPIYAEIDKKTLSIDYELLESKISNKTKAIILQHTFWKTANIKKIREIADKYNILIIEDCTHSLWSKYNDIKHGAFWDFSIFSTGRDKVISWVNGWFLVVNNKKYFKKIDKIKLDLKDAPILLIVRNLFYNVIWFISLKTYNIFWIWKFIIHISRKFKIINEIIESSEIKCKNYNLFYKLPNSLAKLALDDLNQIFFYQKYREELSLYYDSNLNTDLFKAAFKKSNNETLNYFRYPIILKNSESKELFYNFMKENWVLLWKSWSDSNILPKWVKNEDVNYMSDCPLSEELWSKILFLPNNKNTTKKDIDRIILLISKFVFSNV